MNARPISDRNFEHDLATISNIVFVGIFDPISSCFSDGLSRPIRNMTGFTVFDPAKGMGQDTLYMLTTELTSKKARALKVDPDDFTMADFMGLLRHHWHQEQTKNQKTPVLAYHDVNRSHWRASLSTSVNNQPKRLERGRCRCDGSHYRSCQECSDGSFSNGFCGRIRPCYSIERKGARRWKGVSATS